MRKVWIIFFALASGTIAQTPKLAQTGQTFDRAQVSAWINADRVAVGRWDGTLTIFRPARAQEYGPVLTQVLTSPSLKPVVAVIPVSSTAFVISNGDDSLVLCSGDGKMFSCPVAVSYDAKLGTVESGTVVSEDQRVLLVTGHAQGYVATWLVEAGRVKPIQQVLTRSTNPIPSPYQLWDVRGIVPWKNGIVVAGSEDGDLFLFDTRSAQVLARMRYNAGAQRGINSLALSGDSLLVSNCSVGKADKNLWLFRLQGNKIIPEDSLNLVQDTTRKQVFDFSTQLGNFDGNLYFFASTEEGLVWLGLVSNDKLQSLASLKVVSEGGATLALEPGTRNLSAVAYDIDILTVQ
jgi:WD40 repeat protein